MLNPQWLRTFAALIEHGNFTRAAEQLDVTQAAVSQHVQRLESKLGPLVIRRPRQLELTPAGKAVLRYWAELTAAEHRLQHQLSSGMEDEGEVSLITPGSIGMALYPHLLDLQQASPSLSVRHRFAPDPEVLEAVLQNRFELGLVSLKPDDPRLALSKFADEPLELVVPAGAQVESWADLERLGFIDHPDGHAMATRLLNRRYPGKPGIRSVRHTGFTNQITLILEPVSRGLGFSVIPRFARMAFPRQKAIRVVEGSAQVVDTLWLIHRAEWSLSSRADRVVAYLKDRFA